MSTVGTGVQDIRVRDDSSAYRVLYVARLEKAVYVLHSFQKKTRATSRRDTDLAQKRFRELMKEQK